MFKPLGQLLPDALSRLRVQKPVEASQICRVCNEVLGELWDHAVPMRTLSFSRGTVTVAVTGPAWAHEVMTRAEDLKECVNNRLPTYAVRRVRTRVSPSAARGETAP